MTAMEMLIDAVDISIGAAEDTETRMRYIVNQIGDIQVANQEVGFPHSMPLAECSQAAMELIGAQRAIRETLLALQAKLVAVRDG